MMEIHQWQLLLIHFGDYLDLFEDNKTYKKSDFINGINLGREFSESHMAIVFLCKGDTILVVPITNYTPNDEIHWDKIVLDEERYSFFHKRSSIHLSAMRNISKKRIIKEVRPYIPKSLQRSIKNKICSFLNNPYSGEKSALLTRGSANSRPKNRYIKLYRNNWIYQTNLT